MGTITWKTADHRQRLAAVAMLMTQGLPYHEIAAECEVSKNTLSSWIFTNRAYLPRPGRVIHAAKYTAQAEAENSQVVPTQPTADVDTPKPRAKDEPRPINGTGVGILARTAHQCCWPLWGNGRKPQLPEILFCGNPLDTGDPRYCPAHRARSRSAFVAPDPKSSNPAAQASARVRISTFAQRG